MRKIYQISSIVLVAAMAYGCAQESGLGKLKELKEQQSELKKEISDLEKELIASGELKPKEVNSILVTAFKVKPDVFEHKTELRASVASRKNVMIVSETMGRVQKIYVKAGQKVKKGQLLVQLDADILRNSVSELKTQLELASTLFERQQNLWDKKIGTEVQYLQSKNNKEALEAKLATLKSQLAQASIYAPFEGTVDDIPVNEGEIASMGMPLVRIVNQKDMYITADVSEMFLGKFTEGQKVEIYFPALNKEVISDLTAVGQVINLENRTFEIEANLPEVDFIIKANQVAVLTLVDYTNDAAITVPTKVIQKDSKGTYVYQVVKKDGKQVASKLYVTPGVSYDLKTEILDGLSVGQTIANEGFRDLAQDVVVEIQK